MFLSLIKTKQGIYTNLTKALEDYRHGSFLLYAPLKNIADSTLHIADIIGIQEKQIVTDQLCFCNKNYKNFKKTAENYFNCLLKKQHYLVFNDKKEVLYEIPHYYIPFYENPLLFFNIQNQLNYDQEKEIFKYLFQYILTKDLVFLNKIIIKNYKINLDIFKLLEKWIQNPRDNHLIEEIVCILNKKDTEVSDTFVKKKNLIQGENFNDISFISKQLNYQNKKDLITYADNDNKKKNLLLIHLESISNATLYDNRHLLPNLFKIMDQSIRFNRFFAAATSTTMTVTSIFHGNDFELDEFSSYHSTQVKERYGQNLFKTLKQAGWHTEPLVCINKSNPLDIGWMNIWNDGYSKYRPIYTLKDYFFKIRKAITENKPNPFALFLNYAFTHTGISDEELDKESLFENKMHLSYQGLDAMIHLIYSVLEEQQLLENTLVVFYGDHGDDKWTRSMNSGFTHVIEPYMNSISTPFFIHHKPYGSFDIDDLVSSIDVKYVLYYLLHIENPDNFQYRGKNIFKEKNTFAYASSVYINQPDSELIENIDMIKLNNFSNKTAMQKGFSIIDSRYMLLVGNSGLRLYNIAIDRAGYNNLLNFFEFDENGYAIKFLNYGAWRGHFRSVIMTDAQIYDILNHLEQLRKEMKERLKIKYSYLEDTSNAFDFDNFKKISPRKFLYN